MSISVEDLAHEITMLRASIPAPVKAYHVGGTYNGVTISLTGTMGYSCSDSWLIPQIMPDGTMTIDIVMVGTTSGMTANNNYTVLVSGIDWSTHNYFAGTCYNISQGNGVNFIASIFTNTILVQPSGSAGSGNTISIAIRLPITAWPTWADPI